MSEMLEVSVGDVSSQVHGLLLVAILFPVQILDGHHHRVPVFCRNLKRFALSEIVSNLVVVFLHHLKVAVLTVLRGELSDRNVLVQLSSKVFYVDIW